MKKFFFNQILCSSILTLLFFLFASIVWAKNSEASIESTVRSNANTGGNSGGNIQTGDASARSSVKTEVNGSAGENKIKAEASAEASGKKVELEAETEGTENVNIQKEITAEDSSASVEVKTTQGEVAASRAGVFSKISNAIGSFFDKLLSIFS